MEDFLTHASRHLLAVTLGLCATTLPCPTGAQAPRPSAQRRELVGIVRDPAGAPVEGATIEIPGTNVRSNSTGFFRLWTGTADTVTISVRRLGFAAVEALLTARDKQWDTVVVELEPTARKLEGVSVTGTPIQRERWMREFDQRRALGLGVFVTRDDIEARNSSRLSDVLRDRRGVHVVRLGTQRYGVRFATFTGSRGSACQPDVYVDGARAHGLEVDDLLASTIEAVELYDTFATVPMQFAHQANSIPCGTIVIWTRLPSKPDRQELRHDE